MRAVLAAEGWLLETHTERVENNAKAEHEPRQPELPCIVDTASERRQKGESGKGRAVRWAVRDATHCCPNTARRNHEMVESRMVDRAFARLLSETETQRVRAAKHNLSCAARQLPFSRAFVGS